MEKKILALMMLFLLVVACSRPKPVKRAVQVKTGAVKGATNVVK